MKRETANAVTLSFDVFDAGVILIAFDKIDISKIWDGDRNDLPNDLNQGCQLWTQIDY